MAHIAGREEAKEGLPSYSGKSDRSSASAGLSIVLPGGQGARQGSVERGSSMHSFGADGPNLSC